MLRSEPASLEALGPVEACTAAALVLSRACDTTSDVQQRRVQTQWCRMQATCTEVCLCTKPVDHSNRKMPESGRSLQ